MKERLLKKDRTNTGKKTKSNMSKQSWFFNLIGLLFVLVVVSYFFAPYASMHFQNNNAASLNGEQRVMFYSAQCSDCAKVYPKVFWHNVIDFAEPSKQIQTINLDAPTNKHFIAEKGLIATPTFINPANNSNSVITNTKDVSKYINN
ncbi:hypothetical protein WOSG25_050510 [Weissella oryzae SG25]|uniref:Thioredoxin domain-containing protein n=1 Tax=Weissella oryzae (strain DSM 25784 / JCM 18191 / LMG 30913 / SG25) TaxID=1329250 RepID=A0A069CTK7_WEIOS|nr:hypothetical protein [Weissella oryzae]GAK30779.1 hypothetical protein WOSG25_050510 [Weissella oryzae SG25]